MEYEVCNPYIMPGLIPAKLTSELIISMVCKSANVTSDELKSPSRKLPLTIIRHIAMYLCYRNTGTSLMQVGQHFNRDHSSVLHAMKNVANIIETKNKNYYPMLLTLKNRIAQI